MYQDKIGGKNLHDKKMIETAMSQRRLIYNSLEEDLIEQERFQKKLQRRNAKKMANVGT